MTCLFSLLRRVSSEMQPRKLTDEDGVSLVVSIVADGNEGCTSCRAFPFCSGMCVAFCAHWRAHTPLVNTHTVGARPQRAATHSCETLTLVDVFLKWPLVFVKHSLRGMSLDVQSACFKVLVVSSRAHRAIL